MRRQTRILLDMVLVALLVTVIKPFALAYNEYERVRTRLREKVGIEP